MDAGRLEAEVRALEAGHGFVDGSGLRKVAVSGADAERWLNDVVTAGVAGLRAGASVRSLILTPTGRIRADFQVIRTTDGFLLLQDPEQPTSIGSLLEPYVLSSDVSLADRGADLAVYSVPGVEIDLEGATSSRPCLFGDGTDLLAPARLDRLATALAARGLSRAEATAVEAWRIRRGAARFPADTGEEPLPAEAGLEGAIDFTKGCFLGQESVAKVRNLGHPPRLVLALRAEAQVSRGERVMADGAEAGEVTSAAPAPGGTAILARVRWEARSADLATAGGLPLRRA